MTLTDYYTSLDDKYPTLSTLDTTFVYRAINRARRKVAQETDATLYIYTFPFVPATQSYVIPVIGAASMPFIMDVAYYIGNLRLPIDRAPAGFEPLLLFTGWPYWWWPLGGKIYFYPTPATAYTAQIKGKILPDDLIGSVAEALIPESYQEAVVYKAGEFCALKDGNTDLIKGFEELYRQELRTIPRGMM